MLTEVSVGHHHAVKDAEKIAEYVSVIERQHTAMKDHAEWVAGYEAAPPR